MSANRKPEELDAVAHELLSEFVLKKPKALSIEEEAQETPAPVSLSPLSSSSSSSTHSSRSSSASSSSGDGDGNVQDVVEDVLDDEDEPSRPVTSAVAVSNKSGTLIIRRDNVPASENHSKVSNEGEATNTSSSLANMVDDSRQIVASVGAGVGAGVGLGAVVQSSANNADAPFRKSTQQVSAFYLEILKNL